MHGVRKEGAKLMRAEQSMELNWCAVIIRIVDPCMIR